MTDFGWVPDACTLPTEERPLRVAEFDALIAEAAQAVRRDGPERLRFELAPGQAARAAELAARENACCSFFTFTLTIGDGNPTLDIAVPPERSGVLDALQARW